MTASFLIISRAGEIDEYAPHQSGTNTIEVGATLPINVLYVYQPKVHFVYESGGLKGLSGLFCCHVVVGEAMQFVVNKGY
jgi:hypothetical protein